VVENDVVDDYLPILVLLVLSLLFASGSFMASGMLGPRRRPTAAKTAPYECGIVPNIEPPTRFPVRFYLVAMIFIIFDIEIIFLYPWAVVFHQLRSFGLVEIVVFSVVVFISFLFLVSNGALHWGPAKRLVGAMPPRTSSSTIARINVPPPTGVPAAGGVAASTGPSPSAAPDEPSVEPGTAPTGPGRAA
jgi:NADH-quinone oxidoreductase subunit A